MNLGPIPLTCTGFIYCSLSCSNFLLITKTMCNRKLSISAHNLGLCIDLIYLGTFVRELLASSYNSAPISSVWLQLLLRNTGMGNIIGYVAICNPYRANQPSDKHMIGDSITTGQDGHHSLADFIGKCLRERSTGVRGTSIAGKWYPRRRIDPVHAPAAPRPTSPAPLAPPSPPHPLRRHTLRNAHTRTAASSNVFCQMIRLEY